MLVFNPVLQPVSVFNPFTETILVVSVFNPFLCELRVEIFLKMEFEVLVFSKKTKFEVQVFFSKKT